MLTSSVAAILARELRTLRREVEAYSDERQLWQMAPGIPNAAGTLVLHLSGNLRHYVGARLGGSGYVRDRPAGLDAAQLAAMAEPRRWTPAERSRVEKRFLEFLVVGGRPSAAAVLAPAVSRRAPGRTGRYPGRCQSRGE